MCTILSICIWFGFWIDWLYFKKSNSRRKRENWGGSCSRSQVGGSRRAEALTNISLLYAIPLLTDLCILSPAKHHTKHSIHSGWRAQTSLMPSSKPSQRGSPQPRAPRTDSLKAGWSDHLGAACLGPGGWRGSLSGAPSCPLLKKAFPHLKQTQHSDGGGLEQLQLPPLLRFLLFV